MSFRIIWHKGALNDLKQLDKPVRGRIFEKVETYLSQNPASIGKPLKENLAGMFRYRYGDYRVIYVLDLTDQTMTILEVGHRRAVYRR
ncbi:MAG: hypothetical protein A2075_22025 [Geobacteraceae bacterium GWC2_58_44]|nr:MAG: hypothetical protein A2075_22025 [Geobacteraceae bacterium GWC2_58_44]HBG07041.1 type II toxin-antitoxin system mRNA interferase toxin, RelE/StbE family [Geobacter sp.]